jgi:hypothetical protein
MSTSNNVRSQLEVDLIHILQLDIIDEDTADQIIVDLVNNGRQSLVQHRDDILEEIYLDMMNDQSQLLTILKNAVSNRWSSIFYPSYSWLQSFIKQYQTQSSDIYDQIITRTAEYGRQKFINSNDNGEQILFVVIQFLFNLNNERMMDGYIFNRVWYILISTGLQGLEQLDEFIELEDIKEDKKILFLALREYYRPELFSILSKCKIIDCRGLYDSILDRIAEFGWRLGLDHIRNKITPRMYKEFLKHVETIVPIPSLEPTKNEIKNKYLTINETLLDMKAWIEAGEFTSLSLIIKSIVDRYCQHKTLTF